MPQATIDRLIVNSLYAEPAFHWRYNRTTRLFDLAERQRPAGYVVASEDSRAFDDPGVFVEIPLVNRIRPRVRAWREAGWPGVTGITKRLLEHWTDGGVRRPALLLLSDRGRGNADLARGSARGDRAGLEIPSDGGPFPRLCAKMATGSGKTVVMAMLLAWQMLNKAAAPHDARFAKHVLVVAPGLTVRSRLAVLQPAHPENYYEAFHVVPRPLFDKLRQGKVAVRNWHALNWETDEKLAGKRSVDKRGAMSDEAYVRAVLGDLAGAGSILVVNDEAHHAWRVPAGAAVRGVAKDAIQEATKWVGGLDRIARARGILACYDFSATPFAPSGKRSAGAALFDWVVSDFGLNDAIEAGLVKTPRVVVRDDAVPDAETYKSRLYHLYNDVEVKDDLNRRAAPEEPLPDLVMNGYHLLGYDWRETATAWADAGAETPPTMITVTNRTETAALVCTGNIEIERCSCRQRKDRSMKKVCVCVIAVAILALAYRAAPHSGGLDKQGCHAGSKPYHCHGTNRRGGDQKAIYIQTRHKKKTRLNKVARISTMTTFAAKSAASEMSGIPIDTRPGRAMSA